MRECIGVWIILLLLSHVGWAATVNLVWTAPTTNADGSPLTDLSRYHVYQRVDSQPYESPMDVGLATSVSLSLAAGHTYVWIITALDTSLNESLPSNEATKTIDPVPVDSIKPVVAMTAPLPGDVPRRQPVTISAAATDDSGVIAQVDFFINGSRQCTRVELPYSCTWNVPAAGGNRQYTLSAQARDPSGNVGQSAPITVTAR